MKGRNGDRVLVYGRPKVCIRPKLDPVLRRFTLLHELAEWHLERLDYREEDREQAADRLAAALAAPRGAFQRRAKQSRNLANLAERFTISQTCAALRLAETDCLEASVVVSPSLIYARASNCNLPDERTLRAAAAKGSPLFERHALTDIRHRIALLVA